MPKNFITDIVNTKVGLHHCMLSTNDKSGALEIFGPKMCYFCTVENFSVTWVLIGRS